MPPVPRFIKLVSLLAGLAIALSALVLGGAALAMPYIQAGQRPAWMLFGFEVVVLVSGVLAILFGRGKFADGPGLALAMVAGTVMAGSVFGYFGAGKQLGTTSLTPVMGFRVLVGGVLAVAAAYTVLMRDPKSWRVAGLGIVFGLPFVGLAGSMLVGPARRAVMSFLTGGGLIQTGIAVVMVAFVGGLLCASVHLVIKAFAMGRIVEPLQVCPKCGYNWAGLAKCPECGNARAAVGNGEAGAVKV